MKYLLAFPLLFFINIGLQAQDGEYSSYDKRILNPFMYGRSEFHATLTYAIDLDPENDDPGNLAPGHNYGVGVGYAYRVLLIEGEDGLGQNINIGVRADFFPGMYYKANAFVGLELLSLIKKKNFQFVFLPGAELNVTVDPEFSQKKGTSQLYMAKVYLDKFEILWGLQMDWELITDEGAYFLDGGFNVFRVSYRFYR